MMSVSHNLDALGHVIVSSAAEALADMFPGSGEYHNFTLSEVDVKNAIIARLRSPALTAPPAPATSPSH